MAVSQASIAKKLGLARMTVSRALRGESGVAEETRQEIFAAAREAGLPLPPARKLAEDVQLQHVVASLGIASSAEVLFDSRLLDGLRRGAQECASEVMRCDIQQHDSGATRWPAAIDRRQVDGVVIAVDYPAANQLKTCPVPQIFLFQGPSNADMVGVDDFGGGCLLGEHLAAMGHRRIAFLGPDSRMAQVRLAGIRAGLETACPSNASPTDRAALTPVIVLLAKQGGQDREVLDVLLAGETNPVAIRRRFTAIACYNDWFAVHAIKHLNERGIRVPEDLSITGFDNVVPAWYRGPTLTTCAMPLEEIGAEAVRFVYWRITHPNAVRRTLVIETALVKGESVGAV